jgi:hypothetical protein
MRAALLGLTVSIPLFVLAIPNFHSGPCRAGHNEIAAISALRNIASAQELFRDACRVDEDGDGVGEFGTFLELSAALPLRGYVVPVDDAIESDRSAESGNESPGATEIEPEEALASPSPC